MTLFALGALLLTALALALLRPVWQAASPAARSPGAHPHAVVAVDRSDGNLPASSPARASGKRLAGIGVAAAVPIFAMALYAVIGNPAAVTYQPPKARASADTAAGPGDTSGAAAAAPEALQAMLSTMADRLEKSPGTPQDDVAGWTLVGRSYAALQRFGDADRAFARALALAPDDATLLADRADVLTVLQGGRSAGEPERLIGRALAIAPTNPKVLALAGAFALERNDLAAARRDWQQARDLTPPGSEFAADLDRSLASLAGGPGTIGALAGGAAAGRSADAPGMAGGDARAAAGREAPASATSMERASAGSSLSAKTGDSSDPSTSAQAPARISGRVSLAPGLTARAAPGDTVFIFARAAEGPRMPLAILRTTVAQLPRDFTLDDSLAMSPQFRLSAYPRVVVGVRVSRSGSATPQPGDLRGESAPIGTAVTDLHIVIDQVQP